MSLSFTLTFAESTSVSVVSNARARWSSRRGVLLRLEDETGRVGLGEATPLPGYSPDDADACASAIEEVAANLRANDASSVDVWRRLDTLPAARFALETALSDLEAQARGASVAEVLACGEAESAVPRAGLVDLSALQFEDEARALVMRGTRTVKAKIGLLPLDEELARLRCLRRVIGPDTRLRLDANGAFDVKTACEVLGAVAPLEPELVEEPTAGEGLLALGETNVRWAADESLLEERLIEPLLSSPCAAFVVKPALFGLGGALTLALRASSVGKAAIVTHMFDGPVALAAACELALSLPPSPFAHGLEPHGALDLFGPLRVPQVACDGVVVSHRPGLGVA